jgi:diguanylate cyclase (GGDEF)-like protein
MLTMSAAEASTPRGSAPPTVADHPASCAAIEAAVRAERIAMLCGSPAILLFNPVNAAIAAAVLWRVYPVWVILIWLALFVLVVAGRWLAQQSYLSQDAAGRAATRWDRHFVLGASLTGLLWGLAASVVFMTDYVGYHVFISFMLGGMAAGALLQNAAYLPAFVSFATLAVAPQIAAYLLRGDQISLAMGLMLAAFATVVAVAGRRTSSWIGETLRLRFAQTALISDQKEAQERLTKLARFDPLTGLANRRTFVESLEQRIAHSQRQHDGYAVLYLDLDHFKDVNDTLGHPIGDRLLQEVARRLEANVRASDIVARFGGDEFAVLAASSGNPMDAGVLAAKLLAALDEPYRIEGSQIHGGASIGIAVGDPGAHDAETLLSRADVALYQAKAAGRQAFRLFTDAMRAEVHSRVTLAAELRDAIELGQLFVDYQPQVDVTTGRIAGVEALVRWRHPVRGVISPGIFIPAAEQSGVIAPLGRWVLREACRQARRWIDLGIAPACIAVNVSALQFKAWLDLEKDIEGALAEFRLPPELLELEMTETALMETSREHYAFLDRLRGKGVRLAIDDFGTGYSSLLYLRRYPVNRLKIAQEFVSNLVTDPNDAAIVLATIRLARALGLDVIAEGVETAEQLSLLRQWGCREMQGFYFAKPMSPEMIAPLLRSGEIRREALFAVAV